MINLKLPPEVAARAKNSPYNLVRDIEVILKDLCRLHSLVDRNFHCREIPHDVFVARASTVRTIGELNFIYWRDMGSSIKAYCLSTTWRMIELVEGIVQLFARRSVLGPAVIARALMELCTVYILNGASIRRIVIGSATRWIDTVIISEDLEKLINKALYGTRLVPDGNALRQTNVLTQIQKLSKFPGYEEIERYYERLCEVAHPNMAGNARFWTDSVKVDLDGSSIRTGSPNTKNQTVWLILDDTLWTLAWSAVNIIEGFKILNEQVATIQRAFPAKSDAP